MTPEQAIAIDDLVSAGVIADDQHVLDRALDELATATGAPLCIGDPDRYGICQVCGSKLLTVAEASGRMHNPGRQWDICGVLVGVGLIAWAVAAGRFHLHRNLRWVHRRLAFKTGRVPALDAVLRRREVRR